MSALLDTLLTPAQRASCIDSDYGPATSHPLDPRNDDEDLTSGQDWDGLHVEVSYEVDALGRVALTMVSFEAADSYHAFNVADFSKPMRDRWAAAIQREVDTERGL